MAGRGAARTAGLACSVAGCPADQGEVKLAGVAGARLPCSASLSARATVPASTKADTAVTTQERLDFMAVPPDAAPSNSRQAMPHVAQFELARVSD